MLKKAVQQGRSEAHGITRISDATFVRAGETVSRRCPEATRRLFHPPTPRCQSSASPGPYVEPLSDARTTLADFFSILLERRQRGGMKRDLVRRNAFLAVLLVTLVGLQPAARAQHGHQPHGRMPSVLEYLDQLEKPERDEYQKPAQVVEALGLKPGMAVADLGSGSGYFTRRFVEAVTDQGMVYAIDVEPEALTAVKNSIEHMHIPYSAEFILARPDSPKLPVASVDLIFLCNVYHHLEDRPKYFANATSALKAGGRIAIVDFYHDERSGEVGFPKRHLVPRETVLDEMAGAGYRLLREHEFLPRQYFLEFVPVQN